MEKGLCEKRSVSGLGRGPWSPMMAATLTPGHPVSSFPLCFFPVGSFSQYPHFVSEVPTSQRYLRLLMVLVMVFLQSFASFIHSSRLVSAALFTLHPPISASASVSPHLCASASRSLGQFVIASPVFPASSRVFPVDSQDGSRRGLGHGYWGTGMGSRSPRKKSHLALGNRGNSSPSHLSAQAPAQGSKWVHRGPPLSPTGLRG